MPIMSEMGDAPTFPTSRAFVVQFAAGADVPAGALLGRVEHVSSARAARFHSVDELMDFIGRVLSETTALDPLSTTGEGCDRSPPDQT